MKAFKLGDKAIWEQFRWKNKKTDKPSIFSHVTIIDITKGTYVIQFDGSITTKRVNKDTKWLRHRNDKGKDNGTHS